MRNQREDVAAVLAALIDRPTADAAGLALDLVAGETPIEKAVEEAITKGETDWVG